MTVATSSRSGYRETFDVFRAERGQETPAWLAQLRSDGIETFEELGLPGARDEDWRFTSCARIGKIGFDLAAGDDSAPEGGGPTPLAFPGLEGPRLVFVDGRHAPALSTIPELPPGVTVGSLADAIRDFPGLVEEHLDRLARSRREAFTALNSAFLEDGLFVHVPKRTRLPGAVHALFLSTAGAPAATHPRSLVVVEREAEATVVEDFVSRGDAAALTNAVSEVVVGEGAACRHYVIERENAQACAVLTVHAEQARDSRFASHSALIGGSLVRRNVYPALRGEGCESLLNGLYVPRGTQHHDTFMVVRHASPHGDSRQFFRGILDERARGVFSGRIIVHEGAQKTDAKQTNRNLILSEDARVDTKPQLEIYADDVKCTHGATVGQIDPEAVFYLRARGIPVETARGLLIFAFVNEVLDRMELEPVRAGLRSLVAAHLSGACPGEPDA